MANYAGIASNEGKVADAWALVICDDSRRLVFRETVPFTQSWGDIAKVFTRALADHPVQRIVACHAWLTWARDLGLDVWRGEVVCDWQIDRPVLWQRRHASVHIRESVMKELLPTGGPNLGQVVADIFCLAAAAGPEGKFLPPPAKADLSATTTYRTKPVKIEAVRFDAQGVWPEGITAWDGLTPRDMSFGYMATPEGMMHVWAGDYIVTDAKGNKRPYRPDAFRALFEEVSGNSPAPAAGWVDVRKQLPPTEPERTTSNWCLVWTGTGHDIAFYDYEDECWISLKEMTTDVRHWQRLPDPPQRWVDPKCWVDDTWRT